MTARADEDPLRRRWRDVDELFHQALARDEHDRAAFLAEACGDDADLLGQVSRLIAAHLRAGRFLELGAALASIDDQLGPYRVVREVGRGGMGAVFLAERTDQQFDKRVAIKIIRHGLDMRSLLRRFHNERRILASLEHPNIARLLDAGTTAAGLPYFIMEYVEGAPIDAYCSARGLPTSARIELFRTVCAAVSYAHQALVIHRDIKPSNILVTEDGIPKLLDFGIAKVVDADDELVTGGLRPMTPAYASPEQLAGRRTTTLGDVYSLGVVLYELLHGELPGGPDVARRPLRGDLDAIARKAMRADPAERYPSVHQLSDDLLQCLHGRPVTARPGTFAYRAAKLVRRNKVAAASTALVFVTLIGGIVATASQARRAEAQEQLATAAQARAERRFRDVHQMIRAALFDYHDAIKDLAGSTAVRERLVRDTLQLLDGLAHEAAGDPVLQRELAAGYERLADVEGGTMSGNLGDTPAAIRLYRKALDIRAALRAQDPHDVQTLRDSAFGHRKLGTLLLESGDLEQGLAESRSALALFEQLAAADPRSTELQFELGRSHDYVGLFLLEKRDVQGAMASWRRFLAILESLPADEQTSERTRRAYSLVHGRLGEALLQASDLEGALAENRTALALRTELAAAFPLNTDYRRNLAVSHYNHGEILARLDRARDALDEYQRYVAISEALSAADPKNEIFRKDLAHGLIRTGRMQDQIGDAAGALDSYRRGRALWLAEVDADPSHLWKRCSLIEADVRIAVTLAKAHRDREAITAADETRAVMDRTVVEPTNAAVRGFLADTYSDLGEAYAALAPPHGRTAAEMYQRSVEIWRDLGARGLISAVDRNKPALAAEQLSRCNAALAR